MSRLPLPTYPTEFGTSHYQYFLSALSVHSNHTDLFIPETCPVHSNLKKGGTLHLLCPASLFPSLSSAPNLNPHSLAILFHPLCFLYNNTNNFKLHLLCIMLISFFHIQRQALQAQILSALYTMYHWSLAYTVSSKYWMNFHVNNGHVYHTVMREKLFCLFPISPSKTTERWVPYSEKITCTLAALVAPVCRFCRTAAMPWSLSSNTIWKTLSVKVKCPYKSLHLKLDTVSLQYKEKNYNKFHCLEFLT